MGFIGKTGSTVAIVYIKQKLKLETVINKQLTAKQLSKIVPSPALSIPGENSIGLPEKVLQFGTGVLLRGLPDYFIDKANKQGIFNGRIVVVKSTAKGSTDAFEQQDGLYTIAVRGIEEQQTVEENIINASISRVLGAADEWNEVLQCAHDSQIELIISNTTEVGITLVEESIFANPPSSFPAKLTAFLYERFKTFKGSRKGGMVIIPTELITDNGTKLKNIVLQLAKFNQLENEFINWLESSNHFCNSLVDRIVPGKLSAQDQQATEELLGYTDELMIMAEPFCLWAIESDSERVKDLLSFSKVDDGVVIAPDIEKFRELKLRLLNGTHSFSCAIAALAGFGTVKDAMKDKQLSSFVRQLMMEEIARSMNDDLVTYDESVAFANKVVDRFSNPFLLHKWLSISLNYTSKMKMRNVPLIIRYFEKFNKVPGRMALGFAAYIVFMNCRKGSDGAYHGEINGNTFVIEDEKAAFFAEQWALGNTDTIAVAVLSNTELWGTDLTQLNGFATAVVQNINTILADGMVAALNKRSQ